MSSTQSCLQCDGMPPVALTKRAVSGLAAAPYEQKLPPIHCNGNRLYMECYRRGEQQTKFRRYSLSMARHEHPWPAASATVLNTRSTLESPDSIRVYGGTRGHACPRASRSFRFRPARSCHYLSSSLPRVVPCVHILISPFSLCFCEIWVMIMKSMSSNRKLTPRRTRRSIVSLSSPARERVYREQS